MSNFLRLGRQWIDTDEVARLSVTDSSDWQVSDKAKTIVLVSFKQDTKLVEIRLDDPIDTVEALITQHFAKRGND